MSHRVRLIWVVAALALAFRWALLERPARQAPLQYPIGSAEAVAYKSEIAPLETSQTGRIRYDRDIKPILAAKCFSCHGPGAEAEIGPFRLDRREAAILDAIIPGNAAQSPLVARITSDDSSELMPPPGGNRTPLTPQQIALLRRWIDEGASYESQSAFARPVRPKIPRIMRKAWANNAIDAFIAAEHESRGLAPAPEADRSILIRRLSFDLLGLPPSPRDVADFVADARPDAYEQLVDRLLASPRFGERMAVLWLDLVRYADTDGYSKDYHREVWMFRDFVIDSFNENKPFDRFTRQQIAGDLLPGTSREDRVGSGYNRLLMTSQEGCADPKEYTHRYSADRVRNISSVWLGVTLGCAECHDHKFDPFTAKDFYRLAAFFADIEETAVGPQELTRFSSADQEVMIKQLEQQVAELDAELISNEKRLPLTRAAWEAQLKTPADVEIPEPVAKALVLAPEGREPRDRQALDDYFRETMPELQPLQRTLVATRSQRDALVEAIPASLVSKTGPSRTIRLLARGNWADESGEVMLPSYPAALEPLHVPARRLDRLDLANWLTSPENPLVARVFVNRLWKIAFGKGLVATLDNFGARGAAPTHPELLDWLALEFVEGGWNVKALFKLILTSSAYRQSSSAPDETLASDPENNWLARQNRFRLDAEFVRDNALEIGGLLSSRIGGRSVKPYQPDGFWSPRFSEKTYRQDEGEELHRRGLYNYWCRNYLHPALEIFDAPSRQSCTSERKASATPLQALVLLNDPEFGEAACALAGRVVFEAGATFSDRLDYAFWLAQSRPARPGERLVAAALYQKHIQEFACDLAAAEAVVLPGAREWPKGTDFIELAAWTSVAKALLNLYETNTRE